MSSSNRNGKIIVIGISGVTCGGKTTLANAVCQAFPENTLACLSQDDYFFKEDDLRHTWIKNLNHINFDILSSLDMTKMEQDVQDILSKQDNSQISIKRQDDSDTFNNMAPFFEGQTSSPRNGFITNNSQLIHVLNELLLKNNLKLLILEGFCIFNCAQIDEICDFKFYFVLNQDECKIRRTQRVYEPPDCPGYFEQCAWPEHLKQLAEVKDTIKDINYFNQDCHDPLQEVLIHLYNKLK